MFRISASTLFLCLFMVTSATPCGFHNYTPQPTLVDRLLASDEIVLARAAPDNPFRFEAIQALEGDLASADIPQLVDSATRRRLAVDANASVLFSREDTYGPWQRLAFVDADMAPVLGTVMARLPSWEIGEDDDRFSYFATLVEHSDTRIHRLALRELDLADYSLLRDLELEVEPSRLLARLNDPIEAEFRPIRILLLGLSGDDQQRDLLKKGVESSVRSESLFIGAYATALIELAGPEAVTNLASSYLTDQNLSLFTRELLLEAVALHGQTGDPAMDEAIAVSIETALWVDPGLAGAVARRFGSRSDWMHHAALEALLLEGAVLASSDQQDVTQYLTLAREAETAE